MYRRILAISLVLIAVIACQAKDRLAPETLMAKSDGVYYYPDSHGLTDLVADLSITSPVANPVIQQARITYYFAGQEHQRFTIENLPPNSTQLHDELLEIVTPLSDYIVPRPSSIVFRGMTMSVEKTTRILAGQSDANYFMLIGTAKDPAAEVKEYRILLDANGLSHQIENKLKDNSEIIASIDNTPADDHWLISRVSMRVATPEGPRWKIEKAQFQKVGGFWLPSTLETQFRDSSNQPIPGQNDFTVHFSNYRLNQGMAAAYLNVK